MFDMITLIFTSSIRCKKESSFCIVHRYKEPTIKYYDSIPVYFSNLIYQYYNNHSDFLVEIFIVTPVLCFAYFLQFACNMLIIFHLDPNYLLITNCIYFVITMSINVKYRMDNGLNKTKFGLEYSAEWLAFIVYFFYLEIIELRFFDLNKDIKKNIIERCLNENMQLMENFSEDSVDDELTLTLTTSNIN